MEPLAELFGLLGLIAGYILDTGDTSILQLIPALLGLIVALIPLVMVVGLMVVISEGFGWLGSEIRRMF